MWTYLLIRIYFKRTASCKIKAAIEEHFLNRPKMINMIRFGASLPWRDDREGAGCLIKQGKETY